MLCVLRCVFALRAALRVTLRVVLRAALRIEHCSACCIRGGVVIAIPQYKSS